MYYKFFQYLTKLWVIVFFLQVTLELAAQEKIGLSHDPNNGIYAIFNNPSASALYSHDWQVNVIGGHLFGQNDYAYVSNSMVFDLIKNYKEVDIAGKRTDISQEGSGRQLIFDLDGGEKTGVAMASILWPSLLWKKNDKETFGIYLRSNLIASFYDAPEMLGYYEISEVMENPTKIDPFYTSYLTWTDIGFHYSKILTNHSHENKSWGVNARLILPHEGGRFEINTIPTYDRSDNLYMATDLETSSKYTYIPENGPGLRVNGIGLGADIGYQVSNENYSYGVSILDIGFAYYTKNMDTYDIYPDTGMVVYNGADVEDPEDIIGILHDLDAQTDYQVTRKKYENVSMVMGLPTAISLQYRRQLNNNWAVGANITHRIPFYHRSSPRPNSASILAQYRTDDFAMNIPVSIFEYNDVRVGTSLKYKYFLIGSDDILSLMGKHDFSGADIYFAIQIYPFRKQRKSRSLDCYEF